MEKIGSYVKIARIDHWIKQLFVLPGVIVAMFLCKEQPNIATVAGAFFATCFIASANYVINEWLDAEFDKYHPTKKNRPVVSDNLSGKIVYLEYAALGCIGLILAKCTSTFVFYMELWLFVMGILYNVRPFRTKEIVYLDVLSESLNNAIRFLIGWFAVTSNFLPPVSIIIGYWSGGAFLMAIKRYAEYRMINDPELAGRYRKSFQYYTERTLLISSFFYALMSILFCGIFMVKYKIELILEMPILCGLFCYYFSISFKNDSAAQKPEKLFREKGLMLYLLAVLVSFVMLMFWNSPQLNNLLETTLIGV